MKHFIPTPVRGLWTQRLLALLISVLGVLLAHQPAAAQGIIVDPPWPPRPPHPEPLPVVVRGPATVSVDEYVVDVSIAGPVAEISVRQIFRNDTDRTLEGVYTFPLPPGSVVSDLQLTVNDQVLEGRILAKDEARRIYEAIVRERRDPALLEYLDRNLFQTSVFPIPPGESRTVQFVYRQVLMLENGLFRFGVPVATGQSRPPSRVAITVDLIEQPGLRTIYSPSHRVQIDRPGDDRASLSFDTTDADEMEDFVLYFGNDTAALGVNLLSYRPAGEDGFFLLFAAPGIHVQETEVVARDVVVVIDVSGSMEGEKLAQAKSALSFVVSQLNPADRFNLLAFSTGVDRWKRNLQDVSAANRESAQAWIERLQSTGSTDINRALLEAMAQLAPSDDRPAYLLFLTDGLPTQGEDRPDRILANVADNRPADRTVRLFSFGVGYDVNTDLLDQLAENLGGRNSYVLPGDSIDEAVSGFYATISAPVLTDVTIDMAGATIDDSYPFPLPDLFAGGQLLWTGRYEDGGKVSVTVEGMVNGTRQRFQYDDLQLVESGGEHAIARLWATRKIGALLIQARREGADQEVIDAIVDLSLRYGIVTPYTSYLVEEPNLARQVSSAQPAGPVSMRSQALYSVPQSVRQASEADAVGVGAVRHSFTRTRLRDAEWVAARPEIRSIAGKTFTMQRVGGTDDGTDDGTNDDDQQTVLWVDTMFEEGMSSRVLPFASPEYFALAATSHDAAAWLSLSTEMIVVIDGEAVRVTAEGGSLDVAEERARPWWSRLWSQLQELILR